MEMLTFQRYQFNAFNLARFNIRTRALNNTLYWYVDAESKDDLPASSTDRHTHLPRSSQIIGAYTFGYALDSQAFRRSVRAKAAFSVLFCLTMVIWGGGKCFLFPIFMRRRHD